MNKSLLCWLIIMNFSHANEELTLDNFYKNWKDFFHIRPGPKNPYKVNYVSLKKLIKEQKPANSRELYLRFYADENFYDMTHRSYTLMFGSGARAVQQIAVTPDFPRLISYTGNIIIAATGHASPEFDRSNKSIEVARYNLKEDRWDPILITLDKNKPTFDESPHKKCARCHGTPYRPIWKTYSRWPGSYSHRSDFFKNDIFSNDKAGFTQKEAKEILAKVDKLKLLPETTELQINTVLNNIVPEGNKRKLPYAVLGYHGHDMGAALGEFLARFNYRRMARRLSESKDYSKYRLAALAAVFECDEFEKFLAEDVRANHKAPATFEDLLEDTLKVQAQQTIETTKLALSYPRSEELNHRTINGTDREDNDAKRIAGLRYLFEARGVNIKAWSLSRKKGPHTFGYGFNFIGGQTNGLHNLAGYLIPEVVNDYPDLKFLLGLKELGFYPHNQKEICKRLEKALPKAKKEVQ